MNGPTKADGNETETKYKYETETVIQYFLHESISKEQEKSGGKLTVSRSHPFHFVLIPFGVLLSKIPPWGCMEGVLQQCFIQGRDIIFDPCGPPYKISSLFGHRALDKYNISIYI
jgi:hypothetical protein